jgi:hypothetical protein
LIIGGSFLASFMMNWLNGVLAYNLNPPLQSFIGAIISIVAGAMLVSGGVYLSLSVLYKLWRMK